jgi:hypothetical protein
LRAQVAQEADKVESAVAGGEMLIHFTIVVVQVHLY